jgi:hypothetical protein
LAPDRLKSWPVGLAALAVGAGAVILGLDSPLDPKHGDSGVPVVGVAFACLICAGLLSCADGAALHLGRFGRGLSHAVMTYGVAVVLAHGLPVAVLFGRVPTAVVLAGTVLGTVVLVAVAALSPWRAGLLGLREVRQPWRPRVSPECWRAAPPGVWLHTTSPDKRESGFRVAPHEHEPDRGEGERGKRLGPQR